MRTYPSPASLLALCLALSACDRGGEPEDTAPVGPPPLACGTLSQQALPLEVGIEVSGTISGTSETSPNLPSTCAEADGPEAVYYLQTDHTADLLWEIIPDFDGVAYIRSRCDGLTDGGNPATDEACADQDGVLAFEGATALNAEAGTWFFVVDGFTAADTGDYRATARLREIVAAGETCDPEVVLSRCESGYGCDPGTLTCSREQTCDDVDDNDGDGLIDCEDPTDCQTLPICTPGSGLPGAPCEEPSDCAANNSDPFCFSELGQGNPSGSCSEFCNLQSNDCPVSSLCVNVNLPSGNGLCYASCADDGDCTTAGASCQPFGTVKLCLPDCTDDDQCLTAGFCNLETGDCTLDDEVCSGGADDDDDMRIDCEDLDCGADATCQSANTAACLAAVPAVSPVQGDTTGGSQQLAGSCTGMGTAHERIHTFTPGSASEEGFLVADLTSATDQGIYIRTDCALGATELGCTDAQPGGSQESLVVPVQGGVALFVVVDGFLAPAEAGPYELSLAFKPTDETESNDTYAEASTFVDGYAAQIAPEGDVDFIAVVVADDGTNLDIRISGLSRECAARALDPQLTLFDTDGVTALGSNDDMSQTNFCSRLTLTNLDAGTYFLQVQSSQTFDPFGTFPYLVTVNASR